MNRKDQNNINNLYIEGVCKPLNEAMDPGKRERLDELISQFRYSTDPSGDGYYEGPPSEEIIETIRSEFGDNIAQQVEDGSYIMHFPRPHNLGTDSWGDRLANKSPARITAAGKMNRSDVETIKRTLKKHFNA